MSIPDHWRGLFDPGSERTPFWTLRTSDLRGRFGGRRARLARDHVAGKADYLRVSVECPVAGSFRMTPPGGLAASMPLRSTFKDLLTGEAELDAVCSFWSDEPDRMIFFVQQAGVKKALLQASNAVERGFQSLTIAGGEVEVTCDLTRTACEGDQTRIVLAALATLAAAALRTWPEDHRNWAWWRFWNGGGAYLLLAVLAAAFGLFWRLLFW